MSGLIGDLLRFAGGLTSRDLSISGGALPIYWPAPGSTMQSRLYWNYPTGITKAVSQSSGTVKATAGTLYMVFVTTAGKLEIKDGNTSVTGRLSVAVNDVKSWGSAGIPFGTGISISNSGGAAGIVVFS